MSRYEIVLKKYQTYPLLKSEQIKKDKRQFWQTLIMLIAFQRHVLTYLSLKRENGNEIKEKYKRIKTTKILFQKKIKRAYFLSDISGRSGMRFYLIILFDFFFLMGYLFFVFAFVILDQIYIRLGMVNFIWKCIFAPPPNCRTFIRTTKNNCSYKWEEHCNVGDIIVRNWSLICCSLFHIVAITFLFSVFPPCWIFWDL